MWRTIVILSLALVAPTGVQPAFSQDDIESTLLRAQSLYYEARFKDSVALLLPVDAMLRERPDRVSQSISVKLQLALGYIGQNQIAEAKSMFQEVCNLDAAYSLDSNQFAPKVLAIFDDAKKEHREAKCAAFCMQIERLLGQGDIQGLLRLAKEAGDGCACGAAGNAADLLYSQGVDAYKRDDFAQAREKLRAALKFQPQHDLALQYAELVESKTTFVVERMLLDWQKYFEAQEFAKAAAVYRQLESSNIVGKATEAALDQIRGEYRKAASSRVEMWNQSCSTDAALSPDTFREQVNNLLPDQTVAADVVSKLSPCAPKIATAPELPRPGTVVSQGCLQMASQQALVRLAERVEPAIPPQRIPVTPLSIDVKVRIDENGVVTVKEIAGADVYLSEVMRVTIEKWKFHPAIVEEQRRCVETALPIVLRRS